MQLSRDGLIRTSLDELLAAPLAHLISGIDDDETGLDRCGRCTHVSGYTEWVGTGSPVITIGWDWTLHTTTGQPRWLRIDAPRSNIMLVDSARHDIGWTRNQEALAALVDAMNWTDQASRAIGARYS